MSLKPTDEEEYMFNDVDVIPKIKESDLTENLKTKLIERYPTLSKENMSLGEMAESLGLPIYIVRRDRSFLIKRGILKKRGRKIDDADLIKYHSKGLYDCQIAKKLGVVAGTASRRRRKLDLEPNFGYSKERVIKKLESERDRLGHTPMAKEIAPKLLIATQIYFGSFNEAKKAAGLEIYPVGGQRKRQQSILKFLYENESATYKKLAEFFGVNDVNDEVRILEIKNEIRVDRTKRPFVVTLDEKCRNTIAPFYPNFEGVVTEEYPIKNIVNHSIEHGLNYITLRELMRNLIDKGQLNSSELGMFHKETKRYLRFIKDHFSDICNKMGISNVPGKITSHKYRKNIHDSEIDAYVLKIE